MFPSAAIPLDSFSERTPAGGWTRQRVRPMAPPCSCCWALLPSSGYTVDLREWRLPPSRFQVPLVHPLLPGRAASVRDNGPPGHRNHWQMDRSSALIRLGLALSVAGGSDGRGASVGPYALMAWISAMWTQVFVPGKWFWMAGDCEYPRPCRTQE